MSGKGSHRRSAERLRRFALDLPGAWEDHPWGESVAKVGKKVFVFMGVPTEDGSMGLSVKLPDSREAALSMPFTEPTGYGLGRAGWVSASFAAGDEAPVDILCDWIEESYRAIAPKKLIAELDRHRSSE
ncbi:MAG TPA: MmcQ/YjbR family DNA-binding protein [Acidimicrobiales bacterium]|nr:MmcQ/YjbR family DNA-binding protein [Acidimicrobiales bacterium]